jgi:hypothetical protein
VKKAYKKDSFEDAWARYLPPATLAPLVNSSIITIGPNSEHGNTLESENEGGFVTIDIDEDGETADVSSF